MRRDDLPHIRNGGVLPHKSLPMISPTRFRETILRAVEEGGRVAALFGHRPEATRDHGTNHTDGSSVELIAVLADDRDGTLALVATSVESTTTPSFLSMTSRLPEVHLFEREIAEQLGVEPTSHPWLKPVRFHEPLGDGAASSTSVLEPDPRRGLFRFGRAPAEPPLIGVTDFYRVEGDDIHEVAVGPVHAGIIEPGHFRFQCHGEDVFHLEISLGYAHRGVERALVGGPDKRSLHYAETLCGDTTIGHTLAYSHLIEALGQTWVPARAQVLRGIALELERLANHTGDLGALANDVGFLPTASFCGRIRGDFLNLTAALCGNRFGRALVRPGGVGFDIDTATIPDFVSRLRAAAKDVAAAVALLWDTPSVMARFQDTGPLARTLCDQLGLVGPAARASGVERDVRKDFPHDIYRFAFIPTATWQSGDVFARAYVRWLEIEHSLAFIEEQLDALPPGPVRVTTGRLRPEHIAVSLVEGWRGELCHVALTDTHGRFARYKVVDPSFHNWTGLALALRDQQISDFPLCNKSFNLSYCGFDL
jgi:Ni,Fe-hydrogenase III large subunit